MQKGFSMVLILIVAALVGLVFVGVYFYNQSKLVPQSLLNNITEWRIYTDPDQFFSLQYPGDWKIEYFEPGNLENIKDKKDVSFEGKEGKLVVHWTQSYGGGCDPQFYENINFAGEMVDVCHTKDEATNIENYSGLYKKQDEKTNLGIFLEVGVNPPEKNRETVFKVLSSFKFKEMSDETVNWKTYANSNYKFAFDYPNSWEVVESKNPGSSYKAFIELGPATSIQSGGMIGVIVRDQPMDQYLKVLQINENKTKLSEGILGGITATYLLMGDKEIVLAQRNGLLYELTLSPINEKLVFDKLVDSFKFLK